MPRFKCHHALPNEKASVVLRPRRIWASIGGAPIRRAVAKSSLVRYDAFLLSGWCQLIVQSSHMARQSAELEGSSPKPRLPSRFHIRVPST
jgi:hypothetical protein